MKKGRRNWTIEQKLQIIQEADQSGVTEVLRKNNLSPSLFHRWKRDFNENGIAGIQPKYHTVDPELKALQAENDRLKRIVANQALELEFKTELLKKSR